MAELEQVYDAWALSVNYHHLSPGASDRRIVQAEDILGFRIPLAVRAVYEISDGAAFVGGNLMMDPLLADDEQPCLARNSDLLRSWRWGIPEEVIVFGSDGSDSRFGLWLPKANTILPDTPVIEIGAPDDEMRYMAIVGSSFARFARIRTAYYLLLEDPPNTAALDALCLPDELRSDDPDDEAFGAICLWADPKLPYVPPDPIESPVSLKELRERFGGMH